jgi:hypothetical protein
LIVDLCFGGTFRLLLQIPKIMLITKSVCSMLFDGFLPGLLFGVQDESDMLLRNVDYVPGTQLCYEHLTLVGFVAFLSQSHSAGGHASPTLPCRRGGGLTDKELPVGHPARGSPWRLPSFQTTTGIPGPIRPQRPHAQSLSHH